MYCRLCVVVAFVLNFFVTDILTDARNSFISKSINITTLIGEIVEFNCSEYNVESQKPNTQLSWFKSEESLHNIIKKNSHRILLDGSGESLRITNVTYEDAGTYKCVTFNQSHSDHSIYTLTVIGLPNPKVYHMYTSNINVNTGMSVEILCMRYMKGDINNYQYYLDNAYLDHTYLKDGSILSFGGSDERVKVNQYADIDIHNITNEDTGTYECISSNKFRIDHAVTNLNVVKKEGQMDFYNETTYETKHLNETFLAYCVGGKWFKNDKPFEWSYEEDRQLVIKNLTFENAGSYRCNNSLFVYLIRNTNFILNVIDPPEKLSFRLFTSNISAIIGETLQLKCHTFQSTTYYLTWYSWKKNGEPLVFNEDTKNMNFRNDKLILELFNFTPNEIGTYECVAESHYHKAYSSYTLTNDDKKKNVEGVTSILGCLTYIVVFILIGAVTICCILWLRRNQTTNRESKTNKLQFLKFIFKIRNADLDTEKNSSLLHDDL